MFDDANIWCLEESREEAEHFAEYVDQPGKHVGGNYPAEHEHHFFYGRIYAVG